MLLKYAYVGQHQTPFGDIALAAVVMPMGHIYPGEYDRRAYLYVCPSANSELGKHPNSFESSVGLLPQTRSGKA